MTEPVVHTLSPLDVDEAQQLAAQGLQRLRAISETQRSRVDFEVSPHNHIASVQVEIVPVIHWQSQHAAPPTYSPRVRYRSCCNDQEVNEAIKAEIQLVYDTCIRPIPRRLDDSW
jgi:hypothetical protein